MSADPHSEHWAALAAACERIGHGADAQPLIDALDRLSDALQGEITHRPRTPRKPDFWGFIYDDECRIEMCFTPDAPGPRGRFAVPIWTLAQPLEQDEAAVRRPSAADDNTLVQHGT
jgi:hypothetical protein